MKEANIHLLNQGLNWPKTFVLMFLLASAPSIQGVALAPLMKGSRGGMGYEGGSGGSVDESGSVCASC